MNGLATRLMILRSLAGDMSQRQLARLAEMSPAYPGFIERRRKETGVSGHVAARIARLFGCSLEYLVMGEGAPPDVDTVRKAVAKSERKFARAAARLAAREETARVARAAREARLARTGRRPGATAKSA